MQADHINRSQPLSTSFENIEQRRLFAYTAAEYFPLNTSANWTYDATVEGNGDTVIRTMGATTYNGADVIRVRDRSQIAGQQVTIDDLVTNGRNGLFLFRTDVDSTDLDLTIRYASPLRLLPKSIDGVRIVGVTSLLITAWSLVAAIRDPDAEDEK